VVAEVASFPSNTAEELKKAATLYTPLEKSVLIHGSK